MSNSGIYQIRNKINGKIYIGSSQNISIRWVEHRNRLRGNYHRNRHLQNAWNKYGEENFEFSILEIVEHVDNLAFKEQDYLNNLNPEYNIAKYTDAPMRERKASKETREKMSKVRKGKNNPFYGKKHTDATKEHLSKIRSGKGSYFWGKHLTKEHKEKLSSSHSGNKHHSWGKHLSEEHRNNISKSLQGNKCFWWGKFGKDNPMYGKKHSKKTKELISLKNSGENSKSSKLNNDKVLKMREMWKSGKYKQKELAKFFNISVSVVSSVVNYKTWKKVK